MPLFFFDTDDGERADRDDEGQEVADIQAARQLAQVALTEMADGRLPDGDNRSFSVRVRDAQGVPIYDAELSLRGEWLVEPNPA